jgi:glucose/arabinose dehydrogenase
MHWQRRHGVWLVVAATASLVVVARPPAIEAVAVLPDHFADDVVFSGLSAPTVVQFSPDGRVFVGEKRGVVKVFDSLTDTTPTTFVDLRTNTHNFWDRGLLGLALAPDFPADPSVYVLYTHDAPIGGEAPTFGIPGANSDPCPTPPGATADGCVVSTRLSRFVADGNRAGSEQVLVEDWCQQYPSHSAGALAFGADGALYASGGEGAGFTTADYGQKGQPLNPCGDPPGGVGATLTLPTAEGGALRSQDMRTPDDPASLGGTIIRIDPLTGAGVAGNPFADSDDANARRIVAMGTRNPFRLAVRPGTDEVWVGDVGWDAAEEINRITDPTDGVVDNFGWPCYEGTVRGRVWNALDVDLCENLYNEGDSAVVAPTFVYRHRAEVVAGDGCATDGSSITGLAFYAGGGFPDEYDGALFFGDYSRRCVWVMTPGSDGVPDPTTVSVFASGVGGVVDLKVGPDGALYLVEMQEGTIRRIAYEVANHAPVARIVATPTFGHAPLPVAFSAAASTDAEGGPLTYEWDLDGDGQFDDSTEVAPGFTYSADGDVVVSVQVSDDQGLSGAASVVIHVGNVAPEPVIVTPGEDVAWKVGDVIHFTGIATDPEDGVLPDSAFAWSVVLLHCHELSSCHEHVVQEWEGVDGGSFVAPDHEYPSFLDLHLTVTDSNGLSTHVVHRLSPQTVTIHFASSPAGVPLLVGTDTTRAPFQMIAIVGSTMTISAPKQRTIDGVTYRFFAWAHGGGRSQTLVAPAADVTLTAVMQVATISTAATSSAPAVRYRCDLPPAQDVECPT